MDRIIIKGKANLFGSISVKGSKNAALPILASSLLITTGWPWSTIPLPKTFLIMLSNWKRKSISALLFRFAGTNRVQLNWKK